jgi:hypothetical protein
MRFRFTIRDLLWLTVVVAMGVAWWVDRGRNERKFAEQHNLMKPYRIFTNDEGDAVLQNTETQRYLKIPLGRFTTSAPTHK